MPISKEEALKYVENMNTPTLWPTPPGRLIKDSLFIACVKWDPELRGENVGDGQCAMCNRYRMLCDKCCLSGPEPGVSGCCGGTYINFENADTLRKEKLRAKKVFEFIKAKYKEVSGKDYA